MKVASIFRYITNVVNVILWILLIAGTIVLLVILFTNPDIVSIIIVIIIYIYLGIVLNNHYIRVFSY
jgi:hypothetical protein